MNAINFENKEVQLRDDRWVMILDIWDNIIRTNLGAFHDSKIQWTTIRDIR